MCVITYNVLSALFSLVDTSCDSVPDW